MAENIEEVENDIVDAVKNEKTLVPYKPFSKCQPMGSYMPISLATETVESLTRVTDEFGDIPSFLEKELGYSSRIAVCNAFAAEQADAIASIIYQFQDKNAFILADMAGIGKGRVCASLVRYAYQKGKIPVFITLATNLFSDIYRDIDDIGGVKSQGERNPNGQPLILNGYKKKNENSIIHNGNVVVEPPRKKVIDKFFKTAEFPEGYDWMIATYSQFSSREMTARKQWMMDIADKCIFILDEAHKVAGQSTMGRYFTQLVMKSDATLFSSATFAKRPQNMYIFSHKTDLGKSPLGVDQLLRAIKLGGNKLQEFMASTLVRSGQMIRRERSFANCNVDYLYMPDGLTQWSYDRYDESVIRFNELVDYCTTSAFISAREKALERFANEYALNYEERVREAREHNRAIRLGANGELIDINKIPRAIELIDSRRPSNEKAREKWLEEHEGKWFYRYDVGVTKRELFNFIETLLFSIKSKDVVDQAILQMTDRELENKDEKGNVFKSERKVIVSVRSTMESIYAKLGLTVGDTLPKNDLKYYFEALMLNMIKSTLICYQITPELATQGLKAASEENYTLIKHKDWQMASVDFEDDMKYIESMRSRYMAEDLGIPLSPIDYVIAEVSKARRPDWNNYGAGSPTFVVEEITGRNYMLVENEMGTFTIMENKKQENKTVAFNNFNDGQADMILLNTSGSTGASAHSKKSYGDTRPRSMIIHQPELDVNVEVQKRGRIFRTGQINFPSYIYLVSQIPSEVRRLIMLRQKLKSLDANTSANQAQSAKLSEITDAQGKIIEDVDNEYGLKILKEILSTSEFDYFRDFMGDFVTSESEDGRAFMQLTVDKFLKNLQTAPSAKQKEFYDEMNTQYSDMKERMQANNEWDLETDTEDLRASLKTKIMKKAGDGKTFFGDAVYEEDNYIMKEVRPLNKEEVTKLMMKLLDGQNPQEFVNEFSEKVKIHLEEHHIPRMVAQLKVPEQHDYATQEEFQSAQAAYEVKKNAKIVSETKKVEKLVETILFFKPDKRVRIPADQSQFDQLNNIEDGSEADVYYNLGKFVGYKIIGDGSLNRANIQMVFAQLKGQPKVVLKPTPANENALEWMMKPENQPSAGQELAQIDAWITDTNEREIARFLSGNMLGAFAIATSMVSRGAMWKSMRFSRFTTYDGSMLRVGVRLIKADPYAEYELDETNAQFITGINSEDIQKRVKELDVNEVQRNEHDNILFKNEGEGYWDEGNRRKVLSLNIVLGSTLQNNPMELSNRSVIKKSPIYDDAQLESLGDLSVEPMRMTLRGYNSSRTGQFMPNQTANLLVKRIQFDDTEAGWALIKPYLDYINETYHIEYVLQGFSGGEIFDILDPHDIDVTGGSHIQSEREYKYYPIATFNDSSKPAEFVRFDPTGENPNGNYGVVYLKSALAPIEGMAYNLMPADLTIPEMFNFYMTTLTEDQSRAATQRMQDMIDEGKRDVIVGNYAVKRMSTGLAKFIFGTLKLPQIGRLFKSYFAGEFDADIAAAAEQPITEEEIQMVEEHEQSAAIPIAWKSVQDFVILLSHNL
jgi:hypothetical protein